MKKYTSEFERALKEFIQYDPETGILRWIKRPGQRVNVEDVIGSPTKDGHLQMSFRGQKLIVHRVAWFLYYGYWPTEVDHWDTNGFNNALWNLRDADHKINAENKRRANINNRTQLLGVHFRTDCLANPYRAIIGLNGKTVSLGQYATAEEAHWAYIEAKRKLHAGNTL